MNYRLPRTLNHTLAEAAQAFAFCGLHVVPMKPDRSRAFVKYKHKERPSPEQASAYFITWPDALLCIKLPADIAVLDVDPRKRTVEEILCDLHSRFKLPRTYTVETPKGGMHLWIQLPQGCIAKNWTSQNGKFPVDGVDIRTNGGLATMPPSDRGDGVYSWLDWVPIVPLAPIALIEALKPKPYERRCLKPLMLRTSDSASRYGEAALQSELERVLRSPVGSRNDSLFLASANLGSLHAAGIIPDVRGSLERAACGCGLSSDDGARASRMTINSGWLRGLENPRRIELRDRNA